MKNTNSWQPIWVLKGIAMGAADVVPGVSGGTIAFIAGIYDKLIAAIKAVNGTALKLLLKGDFKQFWTHIDGAFLATLFAGIGISIFSLSKIALFLLENHPILIWSFFFGLILASTVVVVRSISPWNPKLLFTFMLGLSIAFWITTIAPTETSEAFWFIWLSGAIAICAMILPGISGSFILLLLGKYEFILEAIKSVNLSVIFIFGFGCVCGLLGFSHFLNWLLTKYRNITVALLAGFMMGSLNKVWPWKIATTTYINSKGITKALTEQNLLPTDFSHLTGSSPQTLTAIGLAFFGFFLVLGLNRFAKNEKSAQ